MNSKRYYTILVALLPIVYLFHNLEEWLVFRANIDRIVSTLPKSLGGYITNEPQKLVTMFGIAIITATIIPIIVALHIWKKESLLHSKILIIAGIATLFNAISHISSSVSLGFLSPGVITGVVLCLPYFAGVAIYNYHFSQIKMKQLSVLALISFAVFVLAILLSWFVGLIFLV